MCVCVGVRVCVGVCVCVCVCVLAATCVEEMSFHLLGLAGAKEDFSLACTATAPDTHADTAAAAVSPYFAIPAVPCQGQSAAAAAAAVLWCAALCYGGSFSLLRYSC